MSAMRSYLSIKTDERKLLLRQQQQQQQQLAQAEQENANRTSRYSSATNNQQSPSSEQQLLDLRLPKQPTDLSQQPSTSSAGGGEAQLVNPSLQRASFELGAQQNLTMSYDQPFRPQIKIEPPTPSPPLSKAGISSSVGHKLHRAQRKSGLSLMPKPLESLSPSDVRKLLVKVLNDDETLQISDRRQLTGELCRVPKDFYDKVWSLLSCTNVGIVIGGKILRSVPILTNMTQDDLNFALKVESLLSGIDCPKLRQVNVELLMALHVILERNPEIRFESDPLDLDKVSPG